MDWIYDPQVWIGFFTLSALEIVLGIDNIIFISILAGKLPKEQQPRARFIGIGLALVARILLLLAIGLVLRLKEPLFHAVGHGFSGKDLIMIAGGLFLLAKATYEIHHKLEGIEAGGEVKVYPSLSAVIGQIVMVDLIFSIDSVVTAIGMVDAKYMGVMVAAVLVAVAFMLLTAGAISGFVERHPTVKMLALAFLVLIGANLVADGFGHHIPKGYTYFAMAFSFGVELLNMGMRRQKAGPPVHLRQPIA